jgi:DNA-binding SARP family transcriptional activator
MLAQIGLLDSVGSEIARGLELALIAGFDLRSAGRSVTVPGGGRRVVAFLALQGRPVRRAYVAGSLWPDETDEHAGALLRGALSRLRRAGLDIVDTIGDRLYLSPELFVDVHEIAAAAECLSRGESVPGDGARWLEALTGELLPDWYEDWVLLERERYQQLRLHALEALCEELTGAGRFALAVQAGLAAVAADPLRESAHRALIEAYLGEGNPGEAMRQYQRYRRAAADELGLVPTARLEAIINGVRQAS